MHLLLTYFSVDLNYRVDVIFDVLFRVRTIQKKTGPDRFSNLCDLDRPIMVRVNMVMVAAVSATVFMDCVCVICITCIFIQPLFMMRRWRTV